MSSYTPLDSQAHRNLRIKVDKNFSHSAEFNLVALGFNEIASIGGCMPIVVTTNDTNHYHTLAAVVGWPEFGNVYCSDTEWMGHAVPLSIQSHPFNYAVEQDKLTVLFDEKSPLITNNSREGDSALFASDGSPSTSLKQFQSMLSNLASGSQQASAFIQALTDLKLLTNLSTTLHFENGETRQSTGLMTINEDTLAQLNADIIHQLHTQGLLVAINAMMLSLRQYNRLVQLTKNAYNPVVKIGLKTSD
jgi:hypothetical protein